MQQLLTKYIQILSKMNPIMKVFSECCGISYINLLPSFKRQSASHLLDFNFEQSLFDETNLFWIGNEYFQYSTPSFISHVIWQQFESSGYSGKPIWSKIQTFCFKCVMPRPAIQILILLNIFAAISYHVEKALRKLLYRLNVSVFAFRFHFLECFGDFLPSISCWHHEKVSNGLFPQLSHVSFLSAHPSLVLANIDFASQLIFHFVQIHSTFSFYRNEFHFSTNSPMSAF